MFAPFGILEPRIHFICNRYLKGQCHSPQPRKLLIKSSMHHIVGGSRNQEGWYIAHKFSHNDRIFKHEPKTGKDLRRLESYSSEEKDTGSKRQVAWNPGLVVIKIAPLKFLDCSWPCL